MKNNQIQTINDPKILLFVYLYPVIKNYVSEKMKNFLEKFEYKNYSIDKFSEKCLIGQNETKICSIIRRDSIDEFIVYVNETNYSLFSTIEPSVFETNLMLNKKVTLIKYATFYESVKIVQYLVSNKVALHDSLWLYAIHSNNTEMIDFLEGKKIKPGNNAFYECSSLKQITIPSSIDTKCLGLKSNTKINTI